VVHLQGRTKKQVGGHNLDTQHNNSIVLGNIVGSNIFNICIVLGIPVIILGEASTVAFGAIDIVFMTLAVGVLWVFSATNRKLKRYEGAMLLGIYGGYAG
jgi:cation:H+ antiporter